jgi:hypothetical protein
MQMRCALWFALITITMSLVWAQESPVGKPDSSRQLTALLLKDASPQTRESVIEEVDKAGGHVVHVLPSGLLIAEQPAHEKLSFLGSGVELASTEKINLKSLAPLQLAAARAWNHLLDPPIDKPGRVEHYPGSCTEGTESLRKNAPPGKTSEFMIGRVVVSLIYPFCEDSEECTVSVPFNQSELDEILARTVEAMDWWASQEPDAQLTFFYEPVKAVAISREPDVDCPPAPSGCVQLDDPFRSETLAALGYPGIDPITQEREYVDDLRHGLQPATSQGWEADWGFIVYVPKSVDAHRSYAIDGGPYEVVWDGINADTIAHETGHVFRAKDEYKGIWPWEQCQITPYCRSCYLGRVITGNGNHGFVNEYSIMKGSIMVGVSSYSRAALGWRNSDATHAGWSEEYILDSGTQYADIIAEDFDGSATVDIAAITATAPSTVTVWSNLGHGSFLREAEWELRSQATSLAWDWVLHSLIVAEVGGPIRRWKRSDDGSWQEEVDWIIEADARALAWLDINYDNRNDLVVALDGGGIEAYTPAADYSKWVQIDAPSTSAVCDAIDMGDFNEDDLPDLVAATSSGLYLWRSDSQGNWILTDHLLADFWLRDVWATDLNGDHHFDLATSLLEGGVRMYVGDGQGALSTFPHPSTGKGRQIWLADFDHNLSLDLALGTWNPPGVQVWLNVDEAGQWNLGPGSEENARVGQIAVADFNSDGFMDIARTTAHERLVWVRFNKGLTGDHLLDPVDTIPEVTSLYQAGCQGSTVIMQGIARDIPLPTGYGTTDITINSVTEVEYRVLGGSWQPAQALDGAFDEESEEFIFNITGPSWGTVEVRARNSVGNSTPIPTSEWFFCFP